ncbi:hypothetical protein B7990_12295 [Fibrobacter sp. UWB4]|nr:hypothetical protein B7990_12295 [Fibrobacter sp. UWB4]
MVLYGLPLVLCLLQLLVIKRNVLVTRLSFKAMMAIGICIIQAIIATNILLLMLRDRKILKVRISAIIGNMVINNGLMDGKSILNFQNIRITLIIMYLSVIQNRF